MDSEKYRFNNYFNYSKTIEKIRGNIKEIAKERTIVLVVDELDRCIPHYAIKVLERLHHIFDGIDNVVIIIAMDKMQIKKALEKIYGDDLDIDICANLFLLIYIWIQVKQQILSKNMKKIYISLFDIKENEYEEL